MRRARAPSGEDLELALRDRALDALSEAVLVADAATGDHQIVYASAAFERLTGYGVEEVIGRNCRFLQGAATDPEAVDKMRTALARHRETTVTVQNVRKDGTSFWNEVTLIPFRAATGEATHVIGVQRDVSEAVEAQRELAAARHRADLYLDVAPALIVLIDADGRLAAVNEWAAKLLGRSEAELLGRAWDDVLVTPDRRSGVQVAYERLMADVIDDGGGNLELEEPLCTQGGRTCWINWHVRRITDDSGLRSLVLAGEDVTRRRRAEKTLAELAFRDPVTHLATRAAMEQELAARAERLPATGGGLALLHLDIDRFRLVNDSLGHPIGDALLQRIGARLVELAGDGGLVARCQSDEFLVLLDGDGDPAQHATSMAQAITAALQIPFLVAGAEFQLTATVGMSTMPGDAVDHAELLSHADAAMYQAKAQGPGSRTSYVGPSHEPLERLSLTTRMRRALADHHFVLHYQPIFSVMAGVIVGCEALIRWQDPDRGLIPPDEFIPAAEETGVIDPIGDWVIEEVCRQARDWTDAGLPQVRVSFNVSPHQLRRRELIDVLRRAIAGAGIEPEALVVEITESAAVEATTNTDRVLKDLRSIGVGVALDDFGAGHSSLARLHKLEVDTLKIDRAFLSSVPEDPDAVTLVTSMLGLASSLGVRVVAEGIETEAQLAYLRERGCDFAQGFLLGRPMPAEQLATLLRSGAPHART